MFLARVSLLYHLPKLPLLEGWWCNFFSPNSWLKSHWGVDLPPLIFHWAMKEIFNPSKSFKTNAKTLFSIKKKGFVFPWKSQCSDSMLCSQSGWMYSHQDLTGKIDHSVSPNHAPTDYHICKSRKLSTSNRLAKTADLHYHPNPSSACIPLNSVVAEIGSCKDDGRRSLDTGVPTNINQCMLLLLTKNKSWKFSNGEEFYNLIIF